MKVVSTFLGLCALSLSSSLFSQPVNDNCGNAITLIVGSECVSEDYTSIAATAEAVAVAENPTCGFYAGADVWFNFTVPVSGNFRVELSGNYWTLYTGSCGSFTEENCSNTPLNYARPDLAGQTVYLRAFRFNSALGFDFDLCVYEIDPPANDDCANATNLSLGVTCTLADYTSIESTSENVSVAANPSCGFYAGGDVWFSFEVPLSGNFRVDLNGTFLSLYSGSCGSFSEIDCRNDVLNYSRPDLAGQTVYLRAFRFNSVDGADFSLCVSEFTPQPNDNCANATELTLGTNCTLQNYSSILSTAEDVSVAANPSCGFYQGGDTWFSFQVPASGQFRIDLDGTFWSLYQGTCGSFTELLCENTSLNFDDPSLASETLYLRTYRFNSSEGEDYDLCIWEIEAPENNNCANATELAYSDTCLAEAFSSQLASGEDIGVAPNPSCGFYQGGDVWFQFQAPPLGNFTVNRPSGNQQFAFYTGSCGDFTEILCDGDDEITFDDPSLGGETIYIRAYRFNNRQGSDFELCLLTNDPVANDNCADAIALSVGETCDFQVFDSFNATDEIGVAADPTCGDYQGNDVWFNFEVPDNGRFAVRRQNVDGDFGYSLYTGTCGNFTFQSCSESPLQTIYNNAGLAGQTAYLRVFNRNSTIGGEFELCIVEVDCSNTLEGTAFIDECGTCVGGFTGLEDCRIDCNGVFDGTAFIDDCGFCAGGSTGETPCIEDCEGIFGGTSTTDDCGECVQGTFFTALSRDSEVKLVPTNLGYNQGFTGTFEVNTVVTQTGITSQDDISISGPLFYGPDLFDRVNNGSYFATQNLDVSEERIEVDLIQATTAAGEASPGSWITSSLNLVFTVSTDQEVVLDLAYDGATNTGLDAVSTTLRRGTIQSGEFVQGPILFSLFASGQDGGGILSSPQSLEANQVYELAITGRSFSGPIVVAVNSFVKASLSFSSIDYPEFNESCTDCAGVPFGTAFIDSCDECVGGDTGLDACCTAPFPAVDESSLTTVLNPSNVGLGWESLPGQIGCQVQLRFAGASSLLGAVIVGGSSANSFNVPGSVLQLNQDYEWRVRCGCSQTPLIAGPFSSWQPFSTAVGASITASPNPVADNTTVTVVSDIQDNAVIAVFDLNGRQVAQLYSGEIQAEQSYRLTFDASGLPNGVYICRYTGQSKTTITKIMVAR
jgi:hypothetical protein